MKNGPDTNGISLRMEALWLDAENRIIQDIVRRIHQNSKITSTADYQINRLHELGRSTEEIEKILKDSLNATYPEMYKLYDDVANWQYVRNKDLYEQINAEFIPPEENEWLIQLSEAVKNQTKDELVNLSQSYGFAIMMGNKRVFTPFAQYYQQYVDKAIMDIISGGYDYNTVIRRVVTQMTNSGLRSVDYASGWSNRTPVAVRRALMTGVSQITQQVNQRNAEILGTDYYEVSWHSSARPEHRGWQGKVYSYKDLVSICGLGSVTGLCGANCYHDYYPFIPGVSERLYSDKWLEEQNIKESYTKTWQGKEYDAYERTQKQRQMETAMRAQREKIDALKAAKVDPDEIMLARAKYQAQLNEYSQFCRKMGLKEQRERIYYDMRGRVAPSKKKTDFTAMGAKNKIVGNDKRIADLEKQFSQLTEGYSYADFIKDFGSIEVGFEGSSDEEIKKAKRIAEELESLRSKVLQPFKNTTRTRKESIEILKSMGIDFNDTSSGTISDEVLSKYADFISDFQIAHPRYFNNNKLKLKSISIQDEVIVGKGKATGVYRTGTKGIEIKKSAHKTKQDSMYSKSDDYELHALAHEYGHYIADTLEETCGVSQADIIQNTILRYFDGDIFKSPKDLKDCLSPYGSTSYDEAFAEAFAEAYTCKEPRKFAEIFKEELEKHLLLKKMSKAVQ